MAIVLVLDAVLMQEHARQWSRRTQDKRGRHLPVGRCPRHHVVNCASVFNLWRLGHADNLLVRPDVVNKKQDLTPNNLLQTIVLKIVPAGQLGLFILMLIHGNCIFRVRVRVCGAIFLTQPEKTSIPSVILRGRATLRVGARPHK